MFDRFVAFRARQSPHATAVSMPNGDVSFAAFDLSIGRVAAALAAEHPRPALAAVEVSDPYLQWLVVLALARLGIASASIPPGAAGAVLPAVGADLLISDAGGPGDGEAGGARRIHATQAWAAAALGRTGAVAAPLRRPADLDAPGQVVTSSGSTGERKAVAISWRAVEARMRNWMDWGADRAALARVLPVLGGSRSQVLAAWAGGGRLLIVPPTAEGAAGALSRLRPTWMIAAPNQLGAVLDALPAGFAPLPDLHVTLLGSHAPLALRRDARLRLSPNLSIAYGTAETGLVSVGPAALLGDDEAACGWLTPGAEVEVVDGAGRPLPSGEAGLLRVRDAEAFGAYRDGAAGAGGRFRDGWYDTGDVASLSALGALRIEGRADERMNFGGVKALPPLIEQAALSCPGVRDAAAFAVPGPGGLDEPWLALVREGADDAAVGAALRRRLPGLPPVRLADVAAVPRNPNGKIERGRLREAVLARRGAGDAAARHATS